MESFQKFTSFTGETILYDDVQHAYTDEHGVPLVSASEYKKKFEKPFIKDIILPIVERKHGVPADVIDDMWNKNSKISTTFGNAIHLTMEQWFKHRFNGTSKNYHLPKHPYLRSVVESFPLKDENVVPEVLLSCVKRGMVGRTDGLVITGEKEGYLIDYKTDADISKHAEIHFMQLSYYAEILKEFGWNITKIELWNWTDKWTCYTSEVLPVVQ